MALHNNSKLVLGFFFSLLLPFHLAQPEVSPSPTPESSSESEAVSSPSPGPASASPPSPGPAHVATPFSSPSPGPAPGPTQSSGPSPGLSPSSGLAPGPSPSSGSAPGPSQSSGPAPGPSSDDDDIDDEVDTQQDSISLPPSFSETPSPSMAPSPSADDPSDSDSPIETPSPSMAPRPSAESADAPSDSDSPIEFDFSPTLAPSADIIPQLKKICDSTDYSALCLATVAPFLDGKTDISSVLDVAIQAGAQFSKYGQATAQKLAGNPGNTLQLASVLNDCSDSFGSALENFGKASDALPEHDKGTINTMLSAVITYAGDCHDSISKDSLLYNISDRLMNMASNCLAISSLMN